MFKGYTVAEVLRDAGSVERDFLDAILSNTVTIVFGAPGVGKTTVVAEMIASGLDGRSFAGRSWSRPLSRVAVITTDADGAIDYATMLDAARELVGTDDDVIIWPIGVPPTQAGWQDLTKLVQVQGPDLVVLDNIGQATAGPLNEDQTATDLWIDLAGLRPNESGGPALLWVAHAPKRGEGGWRQRRPSGPSTGRHTPGTAFTSTSRPGALARRSRCRATRERRRLTTSTCRGAPEGDWR